MANMPTLARLPACKIVMYAGDHLPPHFHIIGSDGREALVEIASLTVLRGSVGKAAMAQAKAWLATVDAGLLNAKWSELNP